MTEMTWTTMHIGGPLSREKCHELEEIVNIEFNYRLVYDVERMAEKGNKPLFLQGEVSYGNPDALLKFCQENGLTYWLHYDAGHEWDSGIWVWKPGVEKKLMSSASAHYYVSMVYAGDLADYAEKGYTLQQVIDLMSAFDVEKVPPLTISAEVL